MSHLTPQIEAILEKLTDVCIDSLQAEKPLDYDEVAELVDSLQRNGFARHANQRLIEYLRERVRSKMPNDAMHRLAAITAVSQQVQELYNAHRVNVSATSPPQAEMPKS